MKKLHILLTAFALLTAGFQPVFAQDEEKSVDQFRVKSDFRLPVLAVPMASDSDSAMLGEPEAVISADSFGVHYIAPASVFKLIQLHRDFNSKIEKTKGYRIQIYAGSSLDIANDAKADFLMSYDDEEYPVYQIWNPPHFRVRVGDFTSRSEAMAQVSNIRKIFPDAFIVSDEVKVLKFKDRKVRGEAVPEVGIDGSESPE